MSRPVPLIALLFLLPGSIGVAQFSIAIDAQKDSFYTLLSNPSDGYIHIPHSNFLPLSGPRPSSEADLSADVWVAWDDGYLYLYAEVKDDTVLVNNVTEPQNDCLEVKIDPDPTLRKLTGIVNARLSALDSSGAGDVQGVDNLQGAHTLPAEQLPSEASLPWNYSRRRTAEGYALEMRLAWSWLTIEGKAIRVGPGEEFGMAVTIHDNDSIARDGSIQWSVGMADEVWCVPQLLGTVQFQPDHRLKFIRENRIDPLAFAGKTYLSADRYAKLKYKEVELENWRYRAGDSAEWGNPLFDDSSWEVTYPRMDSRKKPESGWNGIGWFRIHIAVDSSLRGVPLGFGMWQYGASEVYLDGALIHSFGKVGGSATEEQRVMEQNPHYVVFRNKEDHVLAVRHSNFETEYYNEFGYDAGFQALLIEDLRSWITNREQQVRSFTIYQMLFTVIPALLALLHVLLYVFYPRAKEHLYFVAFILSWGAVAFVQYHSPFYTSFEQVITAQKFVAVALGPSIIFGLLMVYAAVYAKMPRQLYFFVIAVAAIIAWGAVQPREHLVGYCLYVLVGLAALEVARLFFLPGIKRWRGRWLTVVGFAAFMVSLVYQVLMMMKVVPSVGEYGLVYPYGLLVLSILVSVDLSAEFARTRKNLERKLVEVQELSERTLEQERRASEAETMRKLLAADNERKTAELQEARKLQLSMLPKEIPSVPHLNIAVYMQPATEVGGDYYDFHVSSGCTLTVALGDATGHGMKAGIMVATMKGLFSAFGASLDILPFFEKCTKTIKDMHLGNLYMGMIVANVSPERMVIASAGMPPVLIFRESSQIIDELVLKGMPLGAHVGFPYVQREVMLSPGDTILLMSDGLSELFNERQETLEYSKVKELFHQVACQSPETVVAHLTAAGERWSNGSPHNDDITFVVLKVKSPEERAHPTPS